MRLSKAFVPTKKEVPADAQVASHIYMIRGGFIRKIAAGIYNFLPLGRRVIRKIENIIREEMDNAGALEVLMPAASPSELWQETGRWDKFGPQMLRFKDRKGSDFCFGPTHEEVIVDMVRREITSYRDLPINLYQIQTKFRDEMRPRAGLMRSREFIMKDAYSFDIDEEAANLSYDNMYETYKRIFTRCGLEFRPVEADTGAIGGSRSHEFQVLAKSGEDAIVACDSCDYAANVEQADFKTGAALDFGAGELKRVPTPGVKSASDAAKQLQVPESAVIKTLIYLADDKPVAVALRGDRELNEVALKKITGATQLFLARQGQVKKATGVLPGAVSPIGLSIPLYMDKELENAKGMVAGGGEDETHYKGVDVARDCGSEIIWRTLRVAEPGDACPKCSGKLEGFKGIEVGHVFSLGTVYSKPMKCDVLTADETSHPMEMGCYGIGVTRIAAAAIEQNHDDGGIQWPVAIAPYEVAVLPLQMKDDAVVAEGERIYQELLASGVDVILDDRFDRPGAKFKDADLVGYPLRVAIGGRGLKEGIAEVKWRNESEVQKIPLADVVDFVSKGIANAK